MGKYKKSRSDASGGAPKPPRNIYLRGEIVYIRSTDRARQHSRDDQPKDGQKLWVWEYKYDPHYKNSSDWSPRGNMLYLLKDGPGDKAKDVCWMAEDGIRGWREPEMGEGESLIDLDPGYGEEFVVKKEEEKKEEEGGG